MAQAAGDGGGRRSGREQTLRLFALEEQEQLGFALPTRRLAGRRGGPGGVALFGVQGGRWDWVRDVRALVLALDADAAGPQQWRQRAREAARRGKAVAVLEPRAYGGLRGKAVAVLEPRAYGGYKDVHEEYREYRKFTRPVPRPGAPRPPGGRPGPLGLRLLGWAGADSNAERRCLKRAAHCRLGRFCQQSCGKHSQEAC